MKNDSFLMQLPDVIQSQQVVEQSRIVRKELEDSTLPVFKTANGLFDSKNLQNDETINLQKTYERLSGRKKSIIDDISEALPNLVENLETLESFVQKTFGTEVVKASISVKELNTLQFIGVTGFVSKYARRLLAFFFAAESDEFEGSSLKFNESFSKAEIKWIKDNFIDFVNALGAVTVKTDTLDKLIKNIPDIHVNPDNIKSITSIQTNSKVDPLKMQFFNVTNTFVYKFMLMWAEYQADGYKVALEEKRMLEMRALLLKRQREGKEDAKLEKEIAITEDRIARLNYKIRKLEED